LRPKIRTSLSSRAVRRSKGSRTGVVVQLLPQTVVATSAWTRSSSGSTKADLRKDES
jgi:hypothetical protein